MEEVRRRGKWDTWLLGKASKTLSKMMKENLIVIAWAYAYDIHVWGFHENKYGIDKIEFVLPYIERLLVYTKKVLKNFPK